MFAEQEDLMEKIATIGLDLAKQVFQVHGMDRNGKKLLSQKLDRSELMPFFKKLRRCVVAMEATSGAHHWAREINSLGHKSVLIPAQYVKPFVKRGKSDALDAEAIAVAATQEGMRPVRIKTGEEQATATLMKTRLLFVRQRTSAINALRGFLAEFGFVVPSRRINVEKLGNLLRSADDQMPEQGRVELLRVYEYITSLDGEIERLSKDLEKQVERDIDTSRLTTIPGVGKIAAAMIRALVPDPSLFESARHFASWLGLTPRSFSSGGRERLGRISKKGNGALRSLLVLGAFGVVTQARKNGHPLAWYQRLVTRKPFKVAAVAIANKNARIIWALMMKGGTYQRPYPVATEAI
jgi:transposase